LWCLFLCCGVVGRLALVGRSWGHWSAGVVAHGVAVPVGVVFFDAGGGGVVVVVAGCCGGDGYG